MIPGPSLIGARLGSGRYEVLNALGEGGMALVFRARDHVLGCDVVVKVPRRGLLQDDPSFAERFRREVQSLVALSHPYIVKVQDVGEHEGVPFAVMQYLAGGDLSRRIPRNVDGATQPMRLEVLLYWLPKIAEALDFIHRQGFVHRDVKPANILFDHHGQPYLSDFGVAKAIRSSVEQTHRGSLTHTGYVLGTPEYMAPEVIKGEPYDGRADQYALGIMLYELLTGRRPFEGPTPALYAAHLTQEPPLLVEQTRSPRRNVRLAVTRALAKKPDDRHNSCIALVNALQESPLASSDAAAVTAAGLAMLQPPKRSHTFLRWAASLLIVTSVVAIAWDLWNRRNDRIPQDDLTVQANTIVQRQSAAAPHNTTPVEPVPEAATAQPEAKQPEKTPDVSAAVTGTLSVALARDALQGDYRIYVDGRIVRRFRGCSWFFSEENNEQITLQERSSLQPVFLTPEGQVVGNRHDFPDSFSLELPPGGHQIEVATQVLNILRASGGYGVLNPSAVVKFPFVYQSRQVTIEAGKTASLEFTADPQVNLLAADGALAYSPQAYRTVSDQFQTALERIGSDPVVQALNDVYFSVTQSTSPLERSTVWLAFPEHYGGRREYDADQIRQLASWLTLKYWGWLSGPPINTQAFLAADVTPQIRDELDGFRRLGDQLQEQRKRLERFSEIADQLDRAKE